MAPIGSWLSARRNSQEFAQETYFALACLARRQVLSQSWLQAHDRKE